MEPNPQVTPTLRYAAVVVPNYNGGEKRLVPAALMETCMTKTRQNSPESAEISRRTPFSYF